MKPLAETDWLGSRTLYADEAHTKVSENFYDVIDWSQFQWDPEGLRSYLEFGYSILGRTPVKGVGFVPPNTRIFSHGQGLRLEEIPGPEGALEKYRLPEEEIWELIETKLAADPNESVVIPTSGGFDSRILNILYPHKERILAYTYGNTRRQNDSGEVVFAKELCRRLGIQWSFVALGPFHDRIDQWDRIMGPAVHAHGMYHLEFYQGIRQSAPATVSDYLSGIFGDVWAGSFSGATLKGPRDLSAIAFSHGMKADPDQCLVRGGGEARERFWETHREALQDPRIQTIWLIRLKIILISYLLRCPEDFGFRPRSPFLDPAVALAMVQLPEKRKAHRIWQKEWFKKKGLDIENAHLRHSSRNTLDLDALKASRLQPLKTELLREIMNPRYVDAINREVCAPGYGRRFWQAVYHLPKVNGLLLRSGVPDRQTQAYYAYLTLKPLQTLIEKRNAAC